MSKIEILDPMPHIETRKLINKIVDQNGIILKQNAELMELLSKPITMTNITKLKGDEFVDDK